MYYRVKDVSTMTGLSVRMLHHYDRIGLLKPDRLTEAGYREYSQDSLMKLQKIMFLRELDFSLDMIGKMIDSKEEDSAYLLDRQEELLEAKVKRLLGIIDTIKLTRKKLESGETMSNEERFDSFDMSEIEAHKEKYAKEVEERWGETDAYAQSQKKTAGYGPEDFKRIQQETDAIYLKIIERMDRDVSDPEVQSLVHDLRQGITDNFYDCTPEIFAGLGEMYIADPRFTKNLDKYAEGFAAYLSKAIAYYSR